LLKPPALASLRGVSGIYRRNFMLASDSYIVLDDGRGSAWCRGSP
jgi:hypothetical protein